MKKKNSRENDEQYIVFVVRCLQCAILILLLLLGMMLSTLFTSCSHKFYEREIVRTDSLRIVEVQHDSIYRHDSIYIEQYTQGDTVFLTRDRWHTLWRERVSHDTLWRAHTDSIPYPVEVPVEVAVPLTWWQRLRIHLGGITLCLLAIAAGVGAWRIFRKFNI